MRLINSKPIHLFKDNLQYINTYPEYPGNYNDT